MQWIMQCKELIILSRTGFRLLMADVAGTSVVATKYCMLFVPTTFLVTLTVV